MSLAGSEPVDTRSPVFLGEQHSSVTRDIKQQKVPDISILFALNTVQGHSKKLGSTALSRSCEPHFFAVRRPCQPGQIRPAIRKEGLVPSQVDDGYGAGIAETSGMVEEVDAIALG